MPVKSKPHLNKHSKGTQGLTGSESKKKLSDNKKKSDSIEVTVLVKCERINVEEIFTFYDL